MSEVEYWCREGKETGYLSKPDWMTTFYWFRCTPCAVCERRYWDEWAVSDEDWKRYIPEEFQHEEVCRCCYEKFKREKVRRR